MLQTSSRAPLNKQWNKLYSSVGRRMNSVERVARAFYEAEHETGVWQEEHDSLKEEFRRFAREAIHCDQLFRLERIVTGKHVKARPRHR
jgi:hypothetical protein